MKKISLEVFILLAILGLGAGAYVYKSKENNQNKAITNALLNESKKRLKELKEVVKMDSIALYDQKNEFIEHINNLQQLRNHDRNEFKRKLSQLKLVTNADYISRNDSLYKYLQGSR
jgi:uncharacterized protein HemX